MIPDIIRSTNFDGTGVTGSMENHNTTSTNIKTDADPVEPVSNESSLLKGPILTQPSINPGMEDESMAVVEEQQLAVGEEQSLNEPQCQTDYTQDYNSEPSLTMDNGQSNNYDEKNATGSVENHAMTHSRTDSAPPMSTTTTNILTQLSEDTYDDGGGNDQELGYQLQKHNNIPVTPTHNLYSTPSNGLRTKPIAEQEHVHVVTPTDSTIPSNTL